MTDTAFQPTTFPGMTVQYAHDLYGPAMATLSDDGVYRYTLTRTIDIGSTPRRSDVVWIMLNPSTADAMADDQTIRRCTGFSRRWDAGVMHVVNLYALRATHPDELTHRPHPVGRYNDQVIDATLCDAHKPFVVAAWGAHPMGTRRARSVLERVTRRHRVHCLGRTLLGQPSHPLRLSYDTQVEILRPKQEAS